MRASTSSQMPPGQEGRLAIVRIQNPSSSDAVAVENPPSQEQCGVDSVEFVRLVKPLVGKHDSLVDPDGELKVRPLQCSRRNSRRSRHEPSRFPDRALDTARRDHPQTRRRQLRMPCRSVGRMWGGASGWCEPASMAASSAAISAREVEANSRVRAAWVRAQVS